MSALSLLKKVKVQTLSFEKHPCRELDQEVMVHYLNGLALITNEDETVCEKEKEYLSILINSFGLSEDMLETFVNFAENPDEKLILDMMQSFMTKDIKYNFMVDCMMIASIDGNFEDTEKAIIEQYFEMFKITKNEAKDLTHIFEKFHDQDSRALARYFNRNGYIKKELFGYLFDYYKINLDFELNELEKEILTFEFFEPTFEIGELANNAKELMTKPISNGQFFIFLNAMYNENKIKIEDNKVYQTEDETFLMDLNNSDIEFKDKLFNIYNEENYSDKITGISIVFIEIFEKWLSELFNIEYKLAYYKCPWGACGHALYINSFDYYPNNEIIYNDYNESFVILDKQIKSYENNQYFDLRENITSINDSFNSKDVSFRFMKSSK